MWGLIVSIHAPWEGCDSRRLARRLIRCRFQFTHPGKGATRRTATRRRTTSSFNSRTLGRVRLVLFSTHCKGNTFQFTHPGKGATPSLPPRHQRRTFQFTHPGKGATPSRSSLYLSRTFQFTHPGKGATIDLIPSVCLPTSFNSRTLGRVRQHRTSGTLYLYSFNSRTLGRVRLPSNPAKAVDGMFQFTHPGKGATRPWTITAHAGAVSIHAPWEGCD